MIENSSIYSVNRPNLKNDDNVCIAEIKPYLQPFEQKLALRELQLVIGKNKKIDFDGNYALFSFDNTNFLLSTLAYWQRVGHKILYPTHQVLREKTQTGTSKEENNTLHKTRRLRFGSHNIHEYRGKFFPQLVRSLINISSLNEDAIVLDPMCGSGTTIIESNALGYSAIGIDLNPLSVLITKAKYSLEKSSITDLFSLKKDFDSIVNSSSNEKTIWNERDFIYLSNWFSSECLQEISSLIYAIKKSKHPIRDVLLVCLSNIIRTISYQKNSDLRVRKEIEDYQKGAARLLFKKEFENLLDMNLAYKNLDLPSKGVSQIFQKDSRYLESLDVLKNRKANVLITSPPYATALPYLDTDRLSLICLGLSERSKHSNLESQMIGTREISEKKRINDWEFYIANKTHLPSSINKVIDEIALVNHNNDIGFRRKNLPTLLAKYFFSMKRSMESAKNVLESNSKAYYVVGNNSTWLNKEKYIIDTPSLLFDLAESVGWTKSNFCEMELLPSRDIFRKNSGNKEYLLELINK